METLGALIERHDVEVHEHLDRDELVPVLTGLQAQGDVIVVPTRPSAKPGDIIPAEGVPVVRGESGGNTHLLLGECSWAPATARGVDLGVVTVPEVAWLAHPEHGYLGLGPGAYVIRRQREQAEKIRLVAD